MVCYVSYDLGLLAMFVNVRTDRERRDEVDDVVQDNVTNGGPQPPQGNQGQTRNSS
jgi:hypothetical protein